MLIVGNARQALPNKLDAKCLPMRFGLHSTGKIVTFSELLGPNDLALWLFQEVGIDYTDDIEKLKGTHH